MEPYFRMPSGLNVVERHGIANRIADDEDVRLTRKSI